MKKIDPKNLIAAAVGVTLAVIILVSFALNYNKIVNPDKRPTTTEITSAETTSESKDYSLASLVLQDPTDEDFDDLANYTDLRELKISGSFSDSRLAALSKCLNLESLDLSGNNIRDISALSALTRLKKLNLDDNDSIKWGDAVNLRKTLNGCKISFSTSWSRAITNYLKDYIKECDFMDACSAYICDMDDNGIPEVAFSPVFSPDYPFMLVTYLNGRIVEFTDTEMLGFAGSGSVSTHFAFVKGTSMVLAETYGTSSGTAGGNATALWDISGDKYTLKKSATNYSENEDGFADGYEYNSSMAIPYPESARGAGEPNWNVINSYIQQVRNIALSIVLPNYKSCTLVYYSDVAVYENVADYISDNLFEKVTISFAVAEQ
ncbi:putative internalin B (Ivanovii) [Clostridium sp. CAG:413]|nr:putative internalin B (Ivanovii) [Clostridium sp. CAG:413]